jgi:hypothetical protein
MSAPLIENYRFKYKSRGKWIYVPNEHCLRRARHIIKFFNRDVSFPAYFYHYKSGGHVAALHDHLKNDFFFKIDIQKFFYSIARNRVARALASHGLRGAPTYAKWSTVRTPYDDGPRYVLPIGFWQSPHIASLVLMQSPVVDAIERARDKGVLVSVYLDDFVGSHSEEGLLREVYEDIQAACVAAHLVPNAGKLVAPSNAIVAFNCHLTKGSAKVTDARVAEFYAVEQTALAQQSFENYLERVERANTPA